jgi:hypothetical protein
MQSASDLQRTDWLTAADSRLLISKQREQFGMRSNMCCVFVTWGRTKVICVMCLLHEEGQKNTRTRRRLPFRNMLKKRWFVANLIRFMWIYEKILFIYLFSDDLQKVYDSSWIDLDLISRGKFWRNDHRVVTMQRPEKIIVLPRIWSLRLIIKLNVKTLA